MSTGFGVSSPTAKLTIQPKFHINWFDRVLIKVVKWCLTKRKFAIYIYKGSNNVTSPNETLLYINTPGRVGIGC